MQKHEDMNCKTEIGIETEKEREREKAQEYQIKYVQYNFFLFLFYRMNIIAQSNFFHLSHL